MANRLADLEGDYARRIALNRQLNGLVAGPGPNADRHQVIAAGTRAIHNEPVVSDILGKVGGRGPVEADELRSARSIIWMSGAR